MKTNTYILKPTFAVIALAAVLACPVAWGQATATPPAAASKPADSGPAPVLTKFDLDFDGGTPRELIRAIEKSSGKPLNAIVSDADANLVLIPALKMKSVTAAELFEALSRTGSRGPSMFGFRTGGQPHEGSVWSFFHEKRMNPPEPRTCRFFNLALYLGAFKIDDITTAIQTGWKLLEDTSTPTLNFHKDTQLLIAVGNPERLKLIDSVLEQLAIGVQEKLGRAAKQ